MNKEKGHGLTQSLSDKLLSRLSEFIADQMGLYFPRERWLDLERGIQSAAREFGMLDTESFVRWLLSSPLTRDQIELLAVDLTIGETYFFRDKRSYDILGGQILPELIRAREGTERRLRIWSAGCCTGEEPYSMAILLDRVLPDPQQWQVTILATDINTRFLRKATEGAFGEWSFRDAPPWLKETYFNQVSDRRFEILPRIKEMVTFAYLNLAEDVYPSLLSNTNAMDLILCRNVLMYFAAERFRRIVHNFHRALVETGWLAVSPTEAAHQVFSQFTSVSFDGATLYRKENKPSLAPSPAFRGEIFMVPPIPEATVPPPTFVSVPPPLSSEEAVLKTESGAQTSDIKPTSYEEALALFERGDYVEAAQKLKAGSASSETTAESAALLARICANLGELAEARSWVEKAIAADKLNGGLHYLRALILQEQGATEESVTSLRRALYVDPGFVLAHFALGNLALRQQKFKEADRNWTHALDLLSRYPPDEVLPQSDGLAAGRFREMIQSTMSMDKSS
jgi:chemotaxis protein methyltransferase CheR